MATIEETRILPVNIRALIKGFIDGGHEHEQTVDSVLQRMIEASAVSANFYVVKEGEHAVGFLFAEVIRTEHGPYAIMIHSSYVDPSVDRNIWLEMDWLLFQWGKKWNVRDLYFLTRRNPAAFARRLGTNWKVDAFTMRRHYPDDYEEGNTTPSAK